MVILKLKKACLQKVLQVISETSHDEVQASSHTAHIIGQLCKSTLPNSMLLDRSILSLCLLSTSVFPRL